MRALTAEVVPHLAPIELAGMNSRQKDKYSQSKTIAGHRRFGVFSKRNGPFRLPLQCSSEASLSPHPHDAEDELPGTRLCPYQPTLFAKTRGGNRLL